jgi:hypothetical protein
MEGGAITGNTGYFVGGVGGSFTMTGGLVFGRGTDYRDVVADSRWTAAEGTGVVICWSGLDSAVYDGGAATDLDVLPYSKATAAWTTDAQQGSGIAYACGDNIGFIPLSVTVVNRTTPQVVTDFAGLRAAVNAFNSSAVQDTVIEVSGSIDMTEGLTVGNTNHILVLTGGTLKRAAADVYPLRVNAGATLILENITLDGAKNAYGTGSVGLVHVAGGTLILQDGVLLKDNVSHQGGGVRVLAGSLVMNGGEIFGNTADDGGGVNVGGGHFTINGGEIFGNTADDGGGVYVDGGGVTMWGGQIVDNAAANSGGEVYIGSGGSFTMNGGVVFGREDESTGVVFPDTWMPAEDGSGVMVHWSGVDGAVYGTWATTDLRVWPVFEAIAVWIVDFESSDSGILYARGSNDGFIPLPVTVVNKQVVGLEGLTIEDSVYSGSPHPGYGGTVSFVGGTPTVATLRVLYIGIANDGGSYASATPPTNAGSYTVLVTLDDDPTYTGDWMDEFTIGKAASPTPDRPVTGDVTAVNFKITSNYQNTYGPLEYRIQSAGSAYGAWTAYDDDAGIAGLTANTVYTLEVRYAGNGNYNESAASEVQTVTTAKETLTGTVVVSGSHVFGGTLTADTTGLTQPDLGALVYQWYRSGTAITGATASTYSLTADDVGTVLNVAVSAAHYAGSVLSVNGTAVAKAPPGAPGAPGEGSKTTDSVTLTAPVGAGPFQYRLGVEGVWQNSPVFDGLTSDTAYTFYARLMETATHLASPAGPGLVVVTDREPPAAPGLTLTETADGAAASFSQAPAPGTARLIVALYNAAGTLVKIEQKTFALSGGAETLGIAFDRAQYAGGRVAAFVWDEAHIPLCDPQTLAVIAA